MTIFVHKNLWFVLHSNTFPLLTIDWAFVYRKWISIGTTAVDGRMERIVVNLVVGEPGNLLRCATSEE